MSIYNMAVEKLENENKKFSGDKYASAMRDAVLETLCNFCRQDDEFSQAVIQSSGTFSDCMKAVAKGVSGSISDLDAYKKAVRFYFPGADIKCTMTIDLIGTAAEPESKEHGKSVLEMSLDDLF